jgi:hypothetical protein
VEAALGAVMRFYPQRWIIVNNWSRNDERKE